jgi:predicted transcriptional regulator
MIAQAMNAMRNVYQTTAADYGWHPGKHSGDWIMAALVIVGGLAATGLVCAVAKLFE